MPLHQPSVPVAALRERTRRVGSRPLLTYHELETGARVDISATTAANWVGKLAWALDDAGVMAGERVALPVLATNPTHWLALLWGLGVWAAGATISLSEDADVAVVGPGEESAALTVFHAAGDLWGRDAGDVLAQPDEWRAEPVDPLALAIAEPALTHAQVAELEADSSRRLVAPVGATDALLALAAGLVGGGSLVLLDAVAAPDVALRIAEAERATG